MRTFFAPAIASLAAILLSPSLRDARADALDVKLVSITSPVSPGGTVTLVVATEPGATCSGRRQAHFGDEIPLRPPSQVVGADGKVHWSWPTLSGMHPVGKRTVHVACTLGDRSGAVDTVFDVRF